jgi:molybdate transport system substrate-binding protein
VPASDARAALAFVARGECGAGIVYASDAEAEGGVEIVAAIPEAWHAPIVYPAAMVAGRNGSAADFVAALRAAGDVFRRHGFRAPAVESP